ncbi:MAG: tetratricopeptide repeat protein [Verrucomicrobiota bacterium]
MKKFITITLIAIAGTTAAYFYLQRSSLIAKKTIIYAKLPPIPYLDNQPKTLARRILDADAAIQNEAKPTKHLIELTRLYHANGYLLESLHCYQALAALQPENPRWPHLQALILAGYGRLNEAIPLFQKSVELDPSYTPSSIRLGNSFLKQNKFDEAETAYRLALSVEASNPHALMGIGRCRIARKDYESARIPLETAFKASQNKIGGDLLVTVYQKLGLSSQAFIAERQAGVGAYSDLPDPWLLDLYSDCYDAYQVATAGGQAAFGGKARTGYDLVLRAAKLDPRNAYYQFQLGNLSSSDPQRAESHFKKCVELDPDFSDGWTSLHNLYSKTGNPAAADAVLKSGFKHNPDSPALLILMAKKAKEENQLQQAASFLQKSARLRPNEGAAYIEMAQIYFSLNQIDQGMDMMRSALKAEPGHPLPLSTLALHAITSDSEREARDLLKQVENHPRIPQPQVAELQKKFAAQFGN